MFLCFSAQFIKMILETAKAERVLEIGMFTGYTAAAVCSVDCVVINFLIFTKSEIQKPLNENSSN